MGWILQRGEVSMGKGLVTTGLPHLIWNSCFKINIKHDESFNYILNGKQCMTNRGIARSS